MNNISVDLVTMINSKKIQILEQPAQVASVLVAIANHGTKNQEYLQYLLREYRSMRKYKVDLVVLSNIQKELGADVEVIVGTPTKNPWSLPFGHKKIFAERVEHYDFFIYSEDDTLITEKNLDAFVHSTQILPPEYIAGFIRYEVAPDGTNFYCTMHGHYHWDPKSLIRRGDYIFATYTNEHSACFILTKQQLKSAIASGGFLLPARKGRYDMLVTAATDPYTQCGKKKVICISHLHDFCLRHLPDIYLGKIGIKKEIADIEIAKLKSLDDIEPLGPLCQTETALDDASWDKCYYESPQQEILSVIPSGSGRLLSVGCGWGATEQLLIEKGYEVHGIPIDPVIASTARNRGVRMLPPDVDLACKALSGQLFDYIIFPDVLHRFENPVGVLTRFLEFLGRDGALVVSTPNFHYAGVLKKWIKGDIRIRFFGNNSYNKIGLHIPTYRKVRKWLRVSGLKVKERTYPLNPRYKTLNRCTLGFLRNFLTETTLLSGTFH
jgi:2-polyprenyl-3-methyl-5-hydroxy-6-metoxy-1,4-benzoquinol methylase